LRWVFFGAADADPYPEPEARLGADFDAAVFGRGLALPKLGIFFLFLLYVNEHGQSKPQK
jgi:hypothetical protein